MAFDSQYASTPGRPVNLRRDIGVALGQLPISNPAVDNSMGGVPPESGPPTDYRERATAAASSIASSIDPNTPSAFGQFAGGLARGFAGVQSYLQAVTGQQTEQREANTDRQLNRERVQATTEAERARAESERAQADRARQAPAAPTPAADNWDEVRNLPVGSPRLQINRRTGETKPVVDPQGRPLRVQSPPVTPRRGGGGAVQTKTPAQWVAEVRNDTAWTQAHPNATAADIAAEARKRAGQ